MRIIEEQILGTLKRWVEELLLEDEDDDDYDIRLALLTLYGLNWI
jgi:hypothetical protein